MAGLKNNLSTREIDDLRNPAKRRAVLERLAWRFTHNDFKGKFDDGTRTMLANGGAEGTILKSLSAFTDEELLEKIPGSVRAQFNP